MYETLKRLLHLGEVVAKPRRVDGCACCGRCCEAFGGHLHASARDLARWRREGREDLLSRVNRLGWIWVDPPSNRLLDPCPFLSREAAGRKVCSINATKPDMCRDYPTVAHGHRCLNGVFLKL
ncbi:YkgJ family cysteine cluster protein [Trichlorobacter ammonificans]|uniref:Zinc/iron-chelating domain-containing protein n=1 Tax=Trichlorobacter ammonificans TaxID=2916410 RepID=A0ABM9D7A6_9BACT|nr:YkgJ family cysteine cluster protein [Trichlorobacter ammonificans]CAH2030898.1 conserved protein of unknown function [Trichlorobacter ammonificans]